MSNLVELAQQLGGTIGAIDHARDQAAVALEMITGLPVDPPPPPEPSVVMTAYSQKDPRWRNIVFAGGKTLGAAGCYVTCVAMIASLAGYEDTPPEVAAKLREVGAFTGALLSYPQRIPEAYPLLRYDDTHDWSDHRVTQDDLAIVQDELNVGPVIMEVDFVPRTSKRDQHFVVAEMFTMDGDLVITDAIDSADTRLLERYAVEDDDYTLNRWIYGLRLLRVAEA